MVCVGGGCVYPILPGPVGNVCSDIPGANEVRPFPIPFSTQLTNCITGRLR